MTRYEEYGYGDDKRNEVIAAQRRIEEIDKTIADLKEHYRTIFPKREIFK